MAEKIFMPALGQTTAEIRIISWLKAEGDTVDRGEVLLEVETDKATLEVEAAFAGTLLKVLYAPDEVVPAGSVIAYIGEAAEQITLDETREKRPLEDPQPQPTPGQVVPSPAEPVKITPVAQRAARYHNVPLSAVQGTGPGGRIGKTDVIKAKENSLPAGDNWGKARKVIARPTARYLAQQHGIDITNVRGSGEQGLIEKADVQAVIDQRNTPVGLAPPPATTAMTPAAETVQSAVPKQRLTIAKRLTESIQTIPQIRLSTTVNMQQAKNLLSGQRAIGFTELTYTHLILRAVAQALREFPQVNTLWDDEEGVAQLQILSQTNVGLAVATADNLLVPVIPEPDRLSLTKLAQLTNAAVQRARAGKLSESDLTATAITVSNLGMYQVDDFQAIVDPAQTAILAVGRVSETTAVIDGGIRIIPQMKLSLSVDHRVVDGALGARFLGAVRGQLESVSV